MDRFGFIIHPIDFADVYQFFPPSRLFPQFLVKKILFNLAPFLARHVRGIRSLTGNVVEGYFIVCPLLSEQILDLEEEVLFAKVLAAARLAQKLGAKILGIGALASGVGEAGQKIAEELEIGVTNGTSLAGAAVIETVSRAAQVKNLNLSRAKVAIIGATNPIGKICCYDLSKKVAQLSLVAKNQERLALLVDKLKNNASAAIENCGLNLRGAIDDAELIIFTTTASEVTPRVRLEDLRQDVVICDIPAPRNITADMARLRPDLLIIDAAAIGLPHPIRLNLHLGLADGQVYACMAETMILALEGIFDDFSIGWEPALDKVETISRLAQKHGFQPAFTSFARPIT